MALPTTVLQFPDISKVPCVLTEADQAFKGLAGYYKSLGYSDVVGGIRLTVGDFVSRVMSERYSNTLIEGLTVSARPPMLGEGSSEALFDIAICGDIFFRKWKAEIAQDPKLVGALLAYMQSPVMGFMFSLENPISMVDRIIEDHLYGWETKEEALEDDPDRDPNGVFSPEEIKEMLASDFSISDLSLPEVERQLEKFGVSPGLEAEISEVTSASEWHFDEKPQMNIYVANGVPSPVETMWVEDCERVCMESYGVGFTSGFKVKLSADPLEAAYQFDQACCVIHKACRQISSLIYKTTDWAFDA